MFGEDQKATTIDDEIWLRVLLVNFRCERRIFELASHLRIEGVEVIVADASHTMDASDLSTHSAISVVRTARPNPGHYEAWVPHLRLDGCLNLLLNPDVHISADDLQRLADAVPDTALPIACAPLIYSSREDKLATFGGYRYDASGIARSGRATETDVWSMTPIAGRSPVWLSGGCLVLNEAASKVAAQASATSPVLHYCSDVYVCRAIVANAGSLQVIPAVRVLHDAGTSSTSDNYQRFRRRLHYRAAFAYLRHSGEGVVLSAWAVGALVRRETAFRELPSRRGALAQTLYDLVSAYWDIAVGSERNLLDRIIAKG